MALTYTGTGGLFKRFGHHGGRMLDILALMGGTATARVLSGASLVTAGTNMEAYAAESPAVSKSIDGHWQMLTGFQTSLQSMLQQLAALAQTEFLEQIHLDANLPQKTIDLALVELIRQMEATGDDINNSVISVGSQTSISSPVGTPVFALHMRSPRGYLWQTPFPETLRFEVIADANTGATARQETVSVRGQESVSTWDHTWPKGSGSALSISLVDAQLNNAGSTLLYNGAFELWASDAVNTPQDWTPLVGTTGDDFANGGSAYTGTGSLRFIGDGTTLPSLYQEFNKAHATTAGAGGTPATLSPSTRYAVCVWIKVSAVPSTGVLRIALTDGSNTVINDDLGNAQSFTVDLTTCTTSYVAYTGTFQTPTNLPSTVRLQLATTTAIENGKSAYLDDLAMTPVQSLYPGGPGVAGFAGATRCVLGDKYTIAITNTMGVLAALLERVFGLRQRGLVIPYDLSAGETIADSVVA